MKILNPEDLLSAMARHRRVMGIDAAMLATSANVSLKFLSQLENGKTTVDVDSLAKVARALGMEIPELFDLVATGRQVRQRRDELGLDQITGAGLCNVSPRFLSTVEHGKPGKRLNKLFDVLRGFGIAVEVRI